MISSTAKIDCKQIGEEELTELMHRASESQRRRANLNLHPHPADPIQRFLNAVEPDSYICPHCHQEPPKWELLLLVRGRGRVLIFAESGEVLEVLELQAGGPNLLVEVPERAWHTLISLEPGTIFFEMKPGPYAPFSDKDFASWAPREGDPAVGEFLFWLHRAKAGDIYSGAQSLKGTL